ncbi:MAG TPA: CHAT domain-containing protein [Acidimicrobiia bacterium]|nr:CHAT domain-containing protein [Acidimicrobiia bacterium]
MTDNTMDLLDTAYADPVRALELGKSVLEEGSAVGRDLAIVYRALSIANSLLGQFQEAIGLAELARDTAAAAGARDEQLLAILAMVGPVTVVDSTEAGLELVDSSEHLADTPYLVARLSYQRGVIHIRRWERDLAIAAFESALPALRETGDQVMVRSALQNLGILWIEGGDLEKAERALLEALDIAVERHEQPSISGIKHNLGRLAAYRGDVVAALGLLLDSDEIYMRLTGASAPQHVARCEVLISAGLFGEASRLAREIAEQHRSSGDTEHLADALLVSARASLAAGDHETAMSTAIEAAATYEERGRPGHAVEARQLALEARYRREGASQEVLQAASEIATRLESERQMAAAARARLLVGRIAADLGDSEFAVESLQPVSEIRSGPIELRIQARVARARLRRLEGNDRASDAAARSGLNLIDDYQATLGATDLRMGIEQHGAELGSIGLDLAIRSGDPRRILRWMERTRARALRHAPVIPESDEDLRDALGSLRQVEARLREPENRGDERLQRELRRLQESVRSADRLKRATAPSAEGFGIDALLDDLGDRSLLEIAIHGGRLVGVLVQEGRARKLDIGSADRVVRELGHVRFALRRAARRGRRVDVETLSALGRLLLGDIPLGEGEVILVPPPPLMMTPWSALSPLRGRKLKVVPSAEMWWRSMRARPVGDGVVVAGGPDLVTADSEVAEIARLYEDALVLPPGSTVEEVRDAMASSTLAHIACHATFQVENPMFSSLRLGDGDLNVYDIERLEVPPALVVLSACDSGYTETRAGDELAGLTSALLSMGTRSIVASVGLVPDAPATSALMVEFHRGLVEGLEPAAALARAQEAESDDPSGFVAAASFICVGA